MAEIQLSGHAHIDRVQQEATLSLGPADMKPPVSWGILGEDEKGKEWIIAPFDDELEALQAGERLKESLGFAFTPPAIPILDAKRVMK